MNKIIKGVIVGACICIAVGFVLFIGAAAFGGLSGAREIMKDGGITIGVSSEDILEYDTATERTISLAGMDMPDLELELGAGKFEIIESDVKDIVVKSNKKVDVSADGDTIKIHTPKQFYFMKIGIGNEGNNVTIEVPRGMKFEDVEMQIGAGEMNCENIYSEKIRMEIGAGAIYVDSFTCEEAILSVGAGEISVEEGSAEDVDADVGMGNLIFHGKVLDNLDADCGMGNIQMWLEGSEKEHDYEIDCGMGNVVVGDNSYGGVAADQDIDNGADSKFDLDCGMGNLEIYFEGK